MTERATRRAALRKKLTGTSRCGGIKYVDLVKPLPGFEERGRMRELVNFLSRRWYDEKLIDGPNMAEVALISRETTRITTVEGLRRVSDPVVVASVGGLSLYKRWCLANDMDYRNDIISPELIVCMAMAERTQRFAPPVIFKGLTVDAEQVLAYQSLTDTSYYGDIVDSEIVKYLKGDMRRLAALDYRVALKVPSLLEELKPEYQAALFGKKARYVYPGALLSAIEAVGGHPAVAAVAFDCAGFKLSAHIAKVARMALSRDMLVDGAIEYLTECNPAAALELSDYIPTKELEECVEKAPVSAVRLKDTMSSELKSVVEVFQVVSSL